MAENPPVNVEEPLSSSEECEESDESDEEISQGACKNVTCSKLLLPEHIAAYCERQELIRDILPISCDNALVEKVMSNYIIVKEILGNLCWQDKMLCKLVCTTWRAAVNTLIREQSHPVDFVYNTQRKVCNHDKLIKSDDFHNAPMAVLAFVNNAGSTLTAHCKDIIPCPCKTPCTEEAHSSKSFNCFTME